MCAHRRGRGAAVQGFQFAAENKDVFIYNAKKNKDSSPLAHGRARGNESLFFFALRALGVTSPYFSSRCARARDIESLFFFALRESPHRLLAERIAPPPSVGANRSTAFSRSESLHRLLLGGSAPTAFSWGEALQESLLLCRPRHRRRRRRPRRRRRLRQPPLRGRMRRRADSGLLLPARRVGVPGGAHALVELVPALGALAHPP